MNILHIQIAFFAAAGAFFFWLFRRLSKKESDLLAEQRMRIENLTKARACVVAVGESRLQKPNGSILVNLGLEIFPYDLRPSFQTSTVWEIEPARICEIEPGKMLSVKIDDRERTHIYPTAAWAQIDELHCRLWLEKKKGVVSQNKI